MAAVDLPTLASGFLRQARAQSVPARTWLLKLNAEAVAALAKGDVFVTSTAFVGGSSSLTRDFNAGQLLQVTEYCLAQLDKEEADEAPDSSNRIADFSGQRSVWG